MGRQERTTMQILIAASVTLIGLNQLSMLAFTSVRPPQARRAARHHQSCTPCFARKRVLLVGETGAGKSTLANELLDMEDVFETSDGLNSCTGKPQSKTGRLFGDAEGTELEIIDTPGLGDSEGRDYKFKDMILKELEGGVHGIMYVHNAGQRRLSKQTQEAMLVLFSQAACSSKSKQQALLERVAFVFTGSDLLRPVYEKGFPAELERLYGISPCPPLLWTALKNRNPVARALGRMYDWFFDGFINKTTTYVKSLPDDPYIFVRPRARAPPPPEIDGFCIDGAALVTVRGCGSIPLRDLRNGDEVLTFDGWTRVVAWMHKEAATGAVEAVQLFASAAAHPEGVLTLKLTPDHFVMVSAGIGDAPQPRPARLVSRGDYLLLEGQRLARVTNVTRTTMHGAFAPLTSSGHLLVGGIGTSCYVDVGVPFWAVHLFMAAFRQPWWPSRLRPQRDATWIWMGSVLQRARALLGRSGRDRPSDADARDKGHVEDHLVLEKHFR